MNTNTQDAVKSNKFDKETNKSNNMDSEKDE